MSEDIPPKDSNKTDINNELNEVAVDDNNDQLSAEEDNDVIAPEVDAIGDTVFSKHFLFKTLMNTIKLIDSEKESTSEGSQAPVIELDEQSEEELCILWDMSANEDVMSFLSENKAIDLFEGIIFRTNSPRFAEISAGILANISANREVCQNMANRQHFRQLIIDSIGSTDTPFVIQVLRILSISLSNKDVQSLWMATIRQNSEQFFQTIHHSLENCLNCDLLRSELKLINKILYLDDTIGQLWLLFDARNESCKCLTDACEQLLAEDSENIEFLDYLWLTLHSLSLWDNNFNENQLICNRSELLSLFKRYLLDSFGESVDYIVATGHRAGALSAALVIINQILSLSTSSAYEDLFRDSVIECLRELSANCEQYLKHLTEESEDKQSFQLAFDQLLAIKEVHKNFVKKSLVSEDIPQQR